MDLTLLLAALLGAASLVSLAAALVSWGQARRGRARRRLDQYLSGPAAAPVREEAAAAPSPGLRGAVARVVGVLAPRGYSAGLKNKLVQANLAMRPEEFLTLHLGAVVLGLLLGWVLAGPLLGLLGMLAGAVAPVLYLDQAKNRRGLSLSRQVGDALVLMANSLRAGHGFFQALETVSREMGPPISQEFARVLKEINLGVPTEEALQEMALRAKNQDLDLVVTAVLIQRQVGGNLAEILDSIADTIRERVRLQGEVRALTAQGRLSGLIVGGLPFALAAFLLVVNPDYIMTLFQHPVGLLLLVAALVAQGLGAIFIRKIVRIEV